MPSKQSGHQCPAKLLHLPLMESSRRSYGVRKVHANKIKNKRRTKQTKPGWWTDHHHAHWHPVEAQALERAEAAREAAEAGNVVAGGERLQEFTQKLGFPPRPTGRFAKIPSEVVRYTPKETALSSL
jgi:hypothetical protein